MGGNYGGKNGFGILIWMEKSLSQPSPETQPSTADIKSDEKGDSSSGTDEIREIPPISYSQEFRLLQSQELLEPSRFNELLATCTYLSQGDRSYLERMPTSLSQRYENVLFKSQELSRTQSLYMHFSFPMTRSEKEKEDTCTPLDRSDSLYKGLIQPFGIPFSQQMPSSLDLVDGLL